MAPIVSFSQRAARARRGASWMLVLAAAVVGLTAAAAKAAPHVRAPLTAPQLDAATGNNRFGVDLFGQLRTERDLSENMLISPLSVSAALAMTYAGALGRTAEEMADVLQFGESVHAGYGQWLGDLNVPREGYELRVANRLFGQSGFSFRATFLDQLAEDYRAPLERLDFIRDAEAARTHINDWVEDQTHDRIKDLLPQGSISRETRLVLTNAMYFNGQWKNEFVEDATNDQPFHLADGGVMQAPTMFQVNHFRYGEFDDFQMLEMPYAGDDLSMVIMLPNERDGLASLEDSLTAELIDGSIDSLHWENVAVHLPKFSFGDEAKLKEPLQSLGMTDAFSDLANFSGMADEAVKISDVIHKTFIDVSEQGTEAAAATAVIAVQITTAVLNPPPPRSFNADHAFLFAIRDTHTGGLLFLGRMAEPTIAEQSIEAPEPATAALWLAPIVALMARRSRRPAATAR